MYMIPGCYMQNNSSLSCEVQLHYKSKHHHFLFSSFSSIDDTDRFLRRETGNSIGGIYTPIFINSVR